MGLQPSFTEIKTLPVLVSPDGTKVDQDTHPGSAKMLVDGSPKLNSQVQGGMGAEVMRLWIASVDLNLPKSNSIVFEERLLGSPA